MKKQNNYTEKMQDFTDIDEVIKFVESTVHSPVIFDDSRAWALYTTTKPDDEKTPGHCRKYGAYRDYLGGGVRGIMCCNLTDYLNELFTAALTRIEQIINGDDECEPWENNTGVLLG